MMNGWLIGKEISIKYLSIDDGEYFLDDVIFEIKYKDYAYVLESKSGECISIYEYLNVYPIELLDYYYSSKRGVDDIIYNLLEKDFGFHSILNKRMASTITHRYASYLEKSIYRKLRDFVMKQISLPKK